MAKASDSKTRLSQGLLGLMTAVSMAGCGARQSEPTILIESAEEVRVSTLSIDSDREWSSTYGAVRPKLQHVVSLGTVDVPASTVAAQPPADSASSVVVHVHNHTTQTNVVVVSAPARSFRAKKRVPDDLHVVPPQGAAHAPTHPPRTAISRAKKPSEEPRKTKKPRATIGRIPMVPLVSNQN